MIIKRNFDYYGSNRPLHIYLPEDYYQTSERYPNLNEPLVKRIIASAGSWVDIDEKGNVYVDGLLLNEPYLTEKALAECNIELPYQVPDGKVFVMGDYRSVSIDSRNTEVGCISQEQIIGKVIIRFCFKVITG